VLVAYNIADEHRRNIGRRGGSETRPELSHNFTDKQKRRQPCRLSIYKSGDAKRLRAVIPREIAPTISVKMNAPMIDTRLECVSLHIDGQQFRQVEHPC